MHPRSQGFLFENIKFQQVHSDMTNRWVELDLPVVDLDQYNKKLVYNIKQQTDPYTARRWTMKQKNKTKNIYLNKFAQYFGLKDKPSPGVKRKKRAVLS